MLRSLTYWNSDELTPLDFASTCEYLSARADSHLVLFLPRASTMASKVPHLMTLADLSAPQILRILSHAHHQKHLAIPWLRPQQPGNKKSLQLSKLKMPSQSLFNKSIALLFSKRSTRTRVAAETASVLLGGRALFLGREDIQLGVNESPRDTARVIGGMCEGIFARVGDHSEIEVRFPP